MMGKPSIIFSDAKLQQNAVITNKKPKFFCGLKYMMKYLSEKIQTYALFLHRFFVTL